MGSKSMIMKDEAEFPRLPTNDAVRQVTEATLLNTIQLAPQKAFKTIKHGSVIYELFSTEDEVRWFRHHITHLRNIEASK